MTATPVTAPASFYAVVGGNDFYWRVEAPARAIGARCRMIPELGGLYAITQPNDDPELNFPWSFLVDRNDPGYYEVEFPEHEGTAVWIRPDLARATLARAMREQGILTVAEVDDNYLSNTSLNIYLRINRVTKKDQLDHLKSLASMDRIVFSTRWLRDRYHRTVKETFGLKSRDLPDLHVCHNNVAERDWPEVVPGERVRVGWMGSPSHIWDVDLAWPALLHARNLGCETWMIGYDPTRPHGSMEIPGDFEQSAKSKEKIAQWRKVGFRYVPWTLPAQYHRLPLPLDIGLCPLLTNEHTLGKSDVKAVEYTISGAAVVAQDNLVYNRTWVHGETALLVKSRQEMLNAVDVLVHEPALRERLVKNAQQYVREERGERQLREEWTEAVTA